MEKVNEVFFSEKGLTSTSASHLADLAQETILGNEAKLKNMSFITAKVEEVFFELQKIHRRNVRELNSIKFALKRESDRLNLESQQKYKSELEKTSLQYKRMFSQYKEWQIKESDRISKLKIIIPDALQTTYKKLSLLEE